MTVFAKHDGISISKNFNESEHFGLTFGLTFVDTHTPLTKS